MMEIYGITYGIRKVPDDELESMVDIKETADDLHNKIMEYLREKIPKPETVFYARMHTGFTQDGEIWICYSRGSAREDHPKIADVELQKVYREIATVPWSDARRDLLLDPIILHSSWIEPEELLKFMDKHPALARKLYFGV
ncbi:MAG: hypothetical protein Q7K45_05205 [Nanoarchaeota archaeon]|nr:hypothetical protein [Nanoarchaeota archaeon]